MSALGIVLVPLGDSILLRGQRTSTDTAITDVYSAYLVANLVLPFVIALGPPGATKVPRRSSALINS